MNEVVIFKENDKEIGKWVNPAYVPARYDKVELDDKLYVALTATISEEGMRAEIEVRKDEPGSSRNKAILEIEAAEKAQREGAADGEV